jgi:hypothetical protein
MASPTPTCITQPSGQTGKQADMATTDTSNHPQQPTDTYACLARLLHSPAPGREELLDQVYEELLTRESRAYAAGWTDALTEARQTRTGRP